MSSENDILTILRSQPGLKGREIAIQLKDDKVAVNSILWKLQNRGLTRQDNAYRWFVVEKAAAPPTQGQQAPKQLTTLGRLCRYYLECLSLDDEAGVRIFARSQFALDYVELPEIPSITTNQPVTAFPGVDDLFRRLRNDRERKVPYIGYPVRVKWLKSARWEGFMLEPLFLFGFNDEALRPGQMPVLSEDTPAINFSVIKSLAIGNEAFVMDEAAKLAEELGLGDPDAPDFDEVVARLVQIREEWDWKEPINPSRLSSGEPLAKLNAEGIYNRCIVFGCERSPYTKGLEQELAKLQEASEDRYKATALGMWLERKVEPQQASPAEVITLLEPLPLNSEQREAIDHALTRPLTVITGPPGTGKSQVVSCLLIDEASQCDIASALPLLFRAKAAVIIGDPKQLRHISAIPPRRARELLHKHGLADGYAKWAYSENSLFDLASPLSGQDDIIMLRDHHRSHADIIEFSNQHFYEGRLRIATKYDRLRRPSPDSPTVRWVPVQGVVVRPGTGAFNEIEAKAVVKELERLCIQQGYNGTVGVVTPFRAQANRIRDLVNAHPHASLLLSKLELLIDTVHKFQGDERDVIIFSPVVSKGIADGAVGFLKKTDNLFNVAITRARAALIVVGDPAAAKNAGVTYLAAFANYVENLGRNPRRQSGGPDGACSGPDYPEVAKPESG